MDFQFQYLLVNKLIMELIRRAVCATSKKEKKTDPDLAPLVPGTTTKESKQIQGGKNTSGCALKRS